LESAAPVRARSALRRHPDQHPVILPPGYDIFGLYRSRAGTRSSVSTNYAADGLDLSLGDP
jgi:hypothetical protein